jgi:D-arabinose 1-dehydrogenase-like Zn-dependent alcohol dehydrogenase
MLEKGLIKATVTKYYHSLASVPQALEDISQRKVIGKAVVKIGKEQSAQARL